METEFGAGFVHVDTHVSSTDPFHTTESTTRANRYGVSGIPHVMIDGSIAEVGADLCPLQANTYRDDINTRISQTGGTSPVEITGGMSINGNLVTVTANYTLVDAGSFTAHQATLYVYEDDITWCCGYGNVDHWDDATRMVRSTPVSLTTVGQTVTVQQVWDMNTAVGVPANPANLHAVALYELVGGTKAVIQSTDFVTVEATLAQRVKSVPAGNGTATWTVQIRNLANAADTFDLSISGFPWPADFQVAGDPNFYTSHSVAMGSLEQKTVTLRVQTDNVKQAVDGLFSVQSQANAQLRSVTPRLFNGSYAILFVDGDNNTFETPFVDAFANLGYLYDTITSAPAALSSVLGYDAVVWHTAFLSTALTSADEDLLSAYMDQGGRIFLSSMDLTTGKTNPDPFINNYLGVSSWTNGTKATVANGVNGDPITNGMSMSLTFPSQAANRVDTVLPAASASTIFRNENGNSNAVRNERPNHARAVFSTIPQTAFPQTGTAPNTSQTVIANTMTWLFGNITTDVPGGAPASALSRFEGASPNPLTSATSLRFVLSPSAAKAPVSLTIVDASGRLVRSLVSGAREVGVQEATWDGHNAQGDAAPAGLYFAVLKTADGEASQKLIRVR